MALADWQEHKVAFDLWVKCEGEDSKSDIERAKRMLPIILDKCCTAKQKEYIAAYYVEKLSLKEIASRYDVNISSVSRGINTGLNNVYKYLRFSSPLFINVARRKGNIKNGRKYPKRKKKVILNEHCEENPWVH